MNRGNKTFLEAEAEVSRVWRFTTKREQTTQKHFHGGRELFIYPWIERRRSFYMTDITHNALWVCLRHETVHVGASEFLLLLFQRSDSQVQTRGAATQCLCLLFVTLTGCDDAIRDKEPGDTRGPSGASRLGQHTPALPRPPAANLKLTATSRAL